MDKIFIVNKPVGLTSRSVCNQIGRAYKTKKVGHVGTLDPFASGLLIVGINKCTKALTFFDESIKEYVATIKLGIETDTLDNTGVVVSNKNVGQYNEDDINKILSSFLGEQTQIPPLTSAIHYNGKRLYEYARSGEKVDVPSRKINIYDIRLIEYKEDELTFYSKVSKGTYIRTLGSDIAKKMGTVGHLNKLVRAGVSPFTIEESSSLEDVLSFKEEGKSTFDVLSSFLEVIYFDDKKIKDIKNGKIRILESTSKSSKILISDNSKNAVAIYKKIAEDKFEFVRGLF